MAVMLVRAIGLGELAKADADAALPFADVTAQRGYIAIAYENRHDHRRDRDDL